VIVLAVWARAFAGHNARHAHVMTMNPNRDLLISGPPKTSATRKPSNDALLKQECSRITRPVGRATPLRDAPQ
jgi:hypothetical protein